MSDGPIGSFVATPPGTGTPPAGTAGPAKYLDMFPKKYQDDPILKKASESHADIGSFLEAAKRAFDPDVVKIPGEKATPEEKAAFRKALKVPETADKYELLVYEDVPLTEAQLKSTKEWCLKMNYTQEQAKSWYENEVSKARYSAKAGTEAKLAREKAWTEETFKRWGADTPVKEDRFKKAAETQFPKDFITALEEMGALGHPAVKDYIQTKYNPETKPIEGARNQGPAQGGGSLFNYDKTTL